MKRHHNNSQRQQKTEEILTSYHHEMLINRDSSQNTLVAYMRAIRSFHEWVNKDLARTNKNDITKYKIFLNGQDLSRSTASLKFAALKSFFDWCEDSGIIDRTPIPKRFVIKVKKQVPTNVPNAKQFLTMRDSLSRQSWAPPAVPLLTRQTMLELLAGSGLRISAMLSLRRSHIILGDTPLIAIDASDMPCKGSVANRVPLSRYAATTVSRYLEANSIGPGQKLFNCSPSWVRKFLSDLSPAGLKLTPHSLRHFYCCMTYYKNFDGGTKDLVWVRDAAGHSNISVTDNYLKLARSIVSDDQEWEAWNTGLRILQEWKVTA